MANEMSDDPPGFLRHGDDLFYKPEVEEEDDEEEEESDEDDDEDGDEDDETGPIALLKKDAEIYVCSGNFRKVADVLDEAGNYFWLVEFSDKRGRLVKQQIPVQKGPKDIMSLLKSKGLVTRRRKEKETKGRDSAGDSRNKKKDEEELFKIWKLDA